MKNFSELTEEDKIRFSKFAKIFVNEYINVDDKNYIKICRNPNNCHRTNIRVDKDYLINTLNYNWKKIGSQSNRLFNISVDILEDFFEFSIDESYQLLFGFIYPEIYNKFFKPLEPDYINESQIRTNKYKLNKIDNEEKQKNYLEYVYNELIKNTKWRDASFRDIELYNGECKSLQVGINWSTNPPSYSYIPVCLQNYLKVVWGLTYEEVKYVFWGRYDKYLINMKLKRHQPYNLIESLNRTNKYKLNKKEIEYLISLYEDSGIFDRDYALEELQSLVSYLNGLNNSLKLYRIICADSEEDIDNINIGSHYTLNRRNLLKNHYDRGSIQSHCYGDRVFLLTVESSKSNIDVMETLSNNILFPIEEEITLKNKGKGSVILSIEEL